MCGRAPVTTVRSGTIMSSAVAVTAGARLSRLGGGPRARRVRVARAAAAVPGVWVGTMISSSRTAGPPGTRLPSGSVTGRHTIHVIGCWGRGRAPACPAGVTTARSEKPKKLCRTSFSRQAFMTRGQSAGPARRRSSVVRIRRRHGLAPRRNPAALRELVVAGMPQVVGRRPRPAPPQQGRQLGMYLVTGNDEANGALIVNPTGPVRPPRRGGPRGRGYPRRPLGRTGGRVRPARRRAHPRPGGPVQVCPGPPGPFKTPRF